MSTRYTHFVKLDYSGCFDDIFDRYMGRIPPKEVLPHCPGGPLRIYGLFEGKPIRVDVKPNDETFVWGRSEREAQNLARRIKRKNEKLNRMGSIPIGLASVAGSRDPYRWEGSAHSVTPVGLAKAVGHRLGVEGFLGR